MSVEKAAAPPFPSQLLVPHPFQLSAAAAGGGGAHSLRTRRARRRGGRGRRVLRGGGEERRRRTGAAGRTRKVGHEHQQQETASGISHGCTRASLGALEPSAETVPDCNRPLFPFSSFQPFTRPCAFTPILSLPSQLASLRCSSYLSVLYFPFLSFLCHTRSIAC